MLLLGRPRLGGPSSLSAEQRPGAHLDDDPADVSPRTALGLVRLALEPVSTDRSVCPLRLFGGVGQPDRRS
jgi:hypothetical protein